MLGGGLGRLQGLHGLTSDALRKVRIALWDGTIIEASDEVNQDLFWGIRGSGQNYGIVIESIYETWPASNGGMFYNADMVFTKGSVKQIMEIANRLLTPTLNAKLSLLMFFASDAVKSKVYEVPSAASPSIFLICCCSSSLTSQAHAHSESCICWADGRGSEIH